MALDLDDAFVKQFAREAHEAYQRQGSKLRGTVRFNGQVRGSSTTFQKIGAGAATTKVRNGEVPTMTIDHTPVECVLQDFYAADWVDKLDEAKINHDERRVLVNAGAWALGRKTDELIITALDASTQFVGDFSTGLTKDLIFDAFEQLNANDVPDDGMRFCVVGPHQWNELLNIPQFSSSDYVSDQPWMQGPTQVKKWLNINFMMHSGLPLDNGNERKSYMYHQSALGQASGVDITTDITWHGDRAAHFISNMMSQGACLIDELGVVEIRTDNDAVIS